MNLNYMRSCMTTGCHKTRHFLIVLLLFAPLLLMAQKAYIVKGKVSDRTSSIPGVSVVEQGSTHGTLTDLEGNYSFTISNYLLSVRARNFIQTMYILTQS